MFLLVPAHPGSSGQRAVKWLLLLLCSNLTAIPHKADGAHIDLEGLKIVAVDFVVLNLMSNSNAIAHRLLALTFGALYF